jgi:DNA-binding MarR family transcriptional regulator
MNKQQPAKGVFDLATFMPYKLSVLSRLTQSLLASELVEAGVTVAQWRVYLCLAKQGPMHLNGIAEFTMLPQSSLSRSVAQMADRGLVRNVRNEDDRRLARIDLTKQGRTRFEQVTVAIQNACEEAFGMDSSEETRFLETVDELITRLASRLGEPVTAPLAEPVSAPKRASR